MAGLNPETSVRPAGPGRPALTQALWLAARPRTLPLALAPIAVGGALAAADGVFDRTVVAVAGLTTLLLQIGANFANDLFDHERGADTEARRGPERASAQGWLDGSTMRAAIAMSLGGAVVGGSYLVWLGGPTIALLGALAIAAALAYTGGPWPFGYHGLGEIAVFTFFGPVGVCGSYYVQAQALPANVWAAALPIGLHATAVLVVNNLRDRLTDADTGKRTLAVRWGPTFARVEYALTLGIPYFWLTGMWLAGAPRALLLPLLTTPWAVALVARLARSDDARAEDAVLQNETLARTAQLALAFAALLALGWGIAGAGVSSAPGVRPTGGVG